ncbi:MAG: CBS domain-containing protein [Roseitalea sp.]|jgi:CBS domain-containing protein|nr:CBS domain-containing protein [Roseitalea sp.]MBO6723351.1 CBS domain-containing protein [Roseitalea sp.]MBO6745235.1 CBS domain-containing protein [Roseitalea sp.]
MLVHQIMSKPVNTIGPTESIGMAAGLMRKFNVGVLPVVNRQGNVVGIVTDRDLVLSLPWQQSGPVEAVMTRQVVHCDPDQTIQTVAGIMGDHQVRRLTVLDRRERLVGIVSVGDIAENASEQLAGQALGEIVETR